MTGNSLLLDTSIVIDLFKKNEQVVSIIARTPKIYIPVIVLGELYLGSFRSANQAAKSQEIKAFLQTCLLLEMQEATAFFYARAKTGLLEKGKPIPDNDIWIAATALQHDLPIFTTDAHFRHVEGLQLFNPLTSI